MFFYGGGLRRVTTQQFVRVDRLGRNSNILQEEDGKVNAGTRSQTDRGKKSTHAEFSLRRRFEQNSKVLQLLGRENVDIRSQIVKAARLGPEPLKVFADEFCQLVNFLLFARTSVSVHGLTICSGSERRAPRAGVRTFWPLALSQLAREFEYSEEVAPLDFGLRRVGRELAEE